MGVNTINLEDIETNSTETILRVLVKEVNETKTTLSHIVLPLVFKNFNKKYVDDVLNNMCQPCKDLDCCVTRTNSNIKVLFGYLNDYVDQKGNVITSLGQWKSDDEDIKSEMIRVLIKALKECHGEVCVNDDNDHFLIYKNNIYSYDKGKFELKLVSKKNLNGCKHLFGPRIWNFTQKKKIINYANEEESENVYLQACSDSRTEDSTKKIEALRTLCDMLKNASDTPSDKVNSARNDNSNYISDSESDEETIKSSSQQVKKEEEKIDIEDLRSKIKQAQEDMQEEKQRKTTEDESDSSSEKTEKKGQMSEQMQQLFFYFLTNPQALTKTIDQINNTIDSFTDNLNPNTIFRKRKPVNIRKFFSNVNLVLKYIEMLKIIEMKYKQTLEFRCQSEDFDLTTEATEFNHHLRKIWDMINLILAELSALRLQDFVSTVPQCGDIRFDTSSLFTKNQRLLHTSLQKIGFSETNNTADLTEIVLKSEYSSVILTKAITESQRATVASIRGLLSAKYTELKNAIEDACPSSSDDKIEDVFTALANAAKVYDNTLTNIGLNANPNTTATMTALQAKITANTTNTIDIKRIIEACLAIIADIYSLTGAHLEDGSGGYVKQYDVTDGGYYYELGLTYNPVITGKTLDSISSFTDSILGCLHVIDKQIDIGATYKYEVRNAMKAIVSNALYSTGATTFPSQLANYATLSVAQVHGNLNTNNMVDAYQGASYNPGTYWSIYDFHDDTHKSTTSGKEYPFYKDITLAKDYETFTQSAYYYLEEVLSPIFTSKPNFKTAMTNKAYKTALIERRSRLINYLKQFENDVTLSLSFFGEMATSYNSTTNQNMLNSTPACFSQFSPNQGRGQPNNTAQHSQANAPRNIPKPDPEPENNQNTSETATEESSENTGFKLPTQNSGNNRFYSGTKSEYS
jgi:hypothetical protein